jgi:pSer/pThr/pTyr-binding forkhead associated (FHA) protein
VLFDYAALTLRSARADFVRMHDHAFLVGRVALRRPPRPEQTRAIAAYDPTTGDGRAEPTDDAAPLVLAVRKTNDTFPSMITVGRTENNDIAIPDVSVSRFHAFFHHHGKELELADAGSRNGTFVGAQQLPSKGAAMRVSLGDTVRFGHLSFQLLDSARCWDELHRVVG